MKNFLTSVSCTSFIISYVHPYVTFVAGVVSYRHAIEEELEVLYDAYYEELEHYAHIQQQYTSSGGTITPPPGPGPFPGSVELDKNGLIVGHGTATKNPPSHRGKAITNGPKNARESEFDDDEGEPDEYEEEEEYEEDEEEDDEDDEVDVDAEDEVDGRTRGTRRAAATRDRQTNGTKANGRTDDSIFGMSLTAAGMCLLSSLPILFMCFVSISREYD